MTDSELLTTANTVIAQTISLAQNHFVEAYSIPSVALNQHGKIAGSAHLQKNLIKLNRKLFLQNQHAFVEQVIPHEVAHIVCFQKFGKVKPHGPEWQSVMRLVFNIPAEVTHKFDVKNVGMREFAYQCNCSELMLSATRHNKVTRGRQQYRCQKCRAILQACPTEADLNSHS